jgi:hypothetical protein
LRAVGPSAACHHAVVGAVAVHATGGVFADGLATTHSGAVQKTVSGTALTYLSGHAKRSISWWPTVSDTVQTVTSQKKNDDEGA